jgi:hypothetical protein
MHDRRRKLSGLAALSLTAIGATLGQAGTAYPTAKEPRPAAFFDESNPSQAQPAFFKQGSPAFDKAQPAFFKFFGPDRPPFFAGPPFDEGK